MPTVRDGNEMMENMLMFPASTGCQSSAVSPSHSVQIRNKPRDSQKRKHKKTSAKLGE